MILEHDIWAEVSVQKLTLNMFLCFAENPNIFVYQAEDAHT